jgi:DHA2 family multidrug resistance protein
MTEHNPPADSAPPPFTNGQLTLLALASALTTFIVVLDLTIANVSVPTIAAAMGASPREGAWVVTSYAMMDAITVLLAGWLSARFGTARVLVIATLCFGAASVMCGLATSLDMLVIFRVIQGIAGGPVMPLAQTLILSNFPRERASYGLAIWTSTSVLGPIVGPVVGGYICENYHWSWIFLINAPLCLIATAAIVHLMRGRKPALQPRPFDFVGLILVGIAVIAIQLTLDHGHDLDWFGSKLIIALCIIAVVAFCSFLIWELTDEHPFIDLRIFRSRGFTITIIAFALLLGPFFGSLIIAPLWLQTNMGYTQTWSGLSTAPGGLMIVFTAPLVAWLSNRIDMRGLISLGLFIVACAFFWRGQFNSDATYELIIVTQLGVGLGIAFVIAPATTIAISFVKPQEMAMVNGLMSFIRTISVAVATAAFLTYWQDAITRNRGNIVDRFDGPNATGQIGAVGIPPDQVLHHIDTLVQGQSVMLGTNDTYMVFALLATIGAAAIWLAPRPRPRTKAA